MIWHKTNLVRVLLANKGNEFKIVIIQLGELKKREKKKTSAKENKKEKQENAKWN